MRSPQKIVTAFLLLLFFLAVSAIGFRKGLRIGWIEESEVEEEADYTSIPYAAIFQEYAPNIDWDWRLLAALCYEESHFNPLAQSSSGALGLMQLMPKTAYRFGLNDSTVFIPEHNIAAGTQYIAHLQNVFSFISNREEQTKFVLASYNAGPAHIMDARRLAKRYGKSAYIWTDNTEYWLTQLQNDTYAQDSVVLYGSCDAKSVNAYVRKVLRTYRRFATKEE